MGLHCYSPWKQGHFFIAKFFYFFQKKGLTFLLYRCTLILKIREHERRKEMENFKIEKVANMVFISTEDQVWKAWHEADFTEKKMNNAIKKIRSNFQSEVTFTKTF